MRRPLAAVLVTASAALSLAVPANAVLIHRHVIHTAGLGAVDYTEVVKVELPPRDFDDDGCPNRRDSYNGPGCKAPEPIAVPSESVAPTPALVSVASASGGCPSYMSGEASSPTDVNPSSGAGGCFQFLPSTWASLGYSGKPQDAPLSVQFEAMQKECAVAGNDAWDAADPC